MAEWLGHYVLPNARPLGTHRSSNARGLAERMLAAGIDSHIREPFTSKCLTLGSVVKNGSKNTYKIITYHYEMFARRSVIMIISVCLKTLYLI